MEEGIDLDQINMNIVDFSEACQLDKQKPVQDDAIFASVEMEGFRYRVDDTQYPVFMNGNQINNADFPILPIGMMDIWNHLDDQNDEGIDLNDFM